jgi:hypothetical protein
MYTLHEDLCTFMTISCWIILRMRNVSDKSCSENQNTHFMFINFFKKLCHIWDNVEKCGTVRQVKADAIFVIQCMRFACWITRARHTFVICNTYCFSTATIVTWIHLNITFIHTLPLLFSYILMKRSRQKPCENWMLDATDWIWSGIMEI